MIKRYGQSKNQIERENLNKFFEMYPLYLVDADLSNLDLTNIKLNKSVISFVNFTNSDLNHATLNVENSSMLFSLANLSLATLPNGLKVPQYLYKLQLVEKYSQSQDQKEREYLKKIIETIIIDLKKQDLEGLDLKGLDFTSTNLKEARLKDALLFEGFKVPEYYQKLSPPYQYEVRFNHEKLIKYYVDSEDPKEKQNFNRLFDILPLNLNRKCFKKQNLQGINLLNAVLYKTDFKEADLRGALINYSNLKTAILDGARLTEDFVVPNPLSEATMRTFYGHMNKTDENIYIFKNICDIKDFFRLTYGPSKLF